MELVQDNFVEQTQKYSIYFNRYINHIKFLEDRVVIIKKELEPLQKQFLSIYKDSKDRKSRILKDLRGKIEKLQKELITYSHEKMKISDQLVEISKECQKIFDNLNDSIKDFNKQHIIQYPEEQIQQAVQQLSPIKKHSKKIKDKQKEKQAQQVQNIEAQFIEPNYNQQTVQQTDTQQYCLCEGKVQDDENMVGCDNDDCVKQWFHFKCVNLTQIPPEGQQWYCPECIAQQNKKKKKK